MNPAPAPPSDLGQIALDLITHIPVGTYVVEILATGESHIIFVSQRWQEILQLTEAAVLADPSLVYQRLHPEDAAGFMAAKNHAQKAQQPLFWEGRVIIGGEIRWFSMESTPRLRADGRSVREGVVIDITRQKRTEVRLQTSEANLRQLMDRVPIAMSYTDDARHHIVEFVNHQFVELFGYAACDIPTVERWAELAYPDENYRRSVFARWEQAIAESVASGNAVKAIEVKVTCKNGKQVDAKVDTFRVDDFVVVTFVDLTEIKKTQQRLEAILREFPTALALNTLGPDPKIHYLNKGFIDKFGYTLDDFSTVSEWSVLAYPDPAYRVEVFNQWDVAMERANQRHGAMEPIEARITCKDGRVKDVLLSASMLDDMTLVGLLDISEWRNAQRDLEAAIQREQTAEYREKINLRQKLKTSLNAAAVAHEINQPLSRILLHSQLGQKMINRLGQSDHDLIPILAAITTDTNQVVTTIENMRSLLRNVQTQHQQVDLTEIVHSALLYMKSDLVAAHVELLTHGLDQTIPIAGDASQLQIAIVNLLRNSLEALAENAPSDAPQISIEIRCTGPSVELIMGDNGAGFVGNELESIPFSTTKSNGSGIGLYVVTTTVENHQGQIALSQSPLGGAEVRLNFPCLCQKLAIHI